MTRYRANIACQLCATLLLLAVALAGAPEAFGLSYYWGSHPDKERLVFVFPVAIPAYELVRTDTKTLTLTLPEGYWAKDQKPEATNLGATKLIKEVVATPTGLVIDIRTNGFGFMSFPMNERNKLVLDVFIDPLGVKWHAPAKAGLDIPTTAHAAPVPPGAPIVPAGQDPATASPAQPQGEAATLPNAGLQPAPTRYDPPPTPTAMPQIDKRAAQAIANPKAPAAAATPSTAAQPGAQAGAPDPTQTEKGPQSGKIFAVPYNYRAPISSGTAPPAQSQAPNGQTSPAAPATPQAPTLPAPTAKPQEQSPAPKQPDVSSLAPKPTAPSLAQAPTPASDATRTPAAAATASPASEPEPKGDYVYRSKIGAAQEAPKAAPATSPPESQAVAGPSTQPAKPTAPPSPPPVVTTSKPEPAPKTASEPTPVAGPQPIAPGQPPVQPPAQPPVQPQEAGVGSKNGAGQAEKPTEKPAEPPAPATAAAPEAEKKPADAPGGSGDKDAHGAAPGDKKEGGDANEVLATIKKSLLNAEYPKALELLTQLKGDPHISSDMREEVLYLYADALFASKANNYAENYGKIADAYTQAMNYNPKSARIPQALFQMGILNLRVENTKMADTFFNILKKKYPDDDAVPLTFYYWGDYYFNHDKLQEAADQFQYFIQKYPDNKFVREASVGMARALYKLDLNDQAFQITDYIEKRWPRFYVEFPPLLRLIADVNFKSNRLDKAKYAYWTLFNLDPTAEDMDLVLARLGDIYLQQGFKTMAKDVYELALKRFPERDGGLIAQMRLAEEGVYDDPLLKDMFTIFNRPFTTKPVDVYTTIVNKYPNSTLAPLAQLKLAMWYLFNKKYRDALDASKDFVKKFPKNKLEPNAREVGLKALEEIISKLLAENDYTGLAKLWEEHAELLVDDSSVNPETKIGVATGYWKKGETQKALDILEPFFRGPGMQRFAEAALILALNIELTNQGWDKIIELARKVELWDLSERVKDKLTYSLALAYENKDDPEKSQPLWEQLAQNKSSDPAERGYIYYFLAQGARNKNNLRQAYEYAQESLNFFQETKKDPEKVKDLLNLLMDVNERAGRPREALKWAIDYSQTVKKEDQEWPALRFRMAQLYRKLADNKRWQSIMEELVKENPYSLYGRMAATELATQKLEKKAQQFAPTGGF